MVSDPVKQAHLTPDQVDELDRFAVTRSELVIAYLDDPSHGVGIEVEMANHAHLPVWLVFSEKLLHKRVISRLVRGNPACRGQPVIVFTDQEDLETRLNTHLKAFVERMSDPSRPEVLRFRDA